MVSYVQLSMVRFFKVVHCFSALRSAQLIWSTATERLSSDLVAYDISIGWLLVALYSLHGLLMFPHLSFVTPIFFHIHARHSWEEFKSVGEAVRPFCSPNSLTNLWGEEFSALVALQFRLQEVGRESVEICQVENRKLYFFETAWTLWNSCVMSSLFVDRLSPQTCSSMTWYDLPVVCVHFFAHCMYI